MIIYEPGQRVARIFDDDPENLLHPVRQGVVRAFDRDTQIVTVGWDDGTITPVRMTDGDHLHILAPPEPINEQAWQHLLTTVTERGSQHGLAALEQWMRQRSELTAVRHRALARELLRDLADGDLNASAGLPCYETSTYARPLANWQLSDLLAGGNPAAWQPVATTWWEQAAWAYRDGFETAVRERAGDWARRTLIPAADGRDLADLRPERVRVGQIAAFSGDWMWQQSDDGTDFVRIGFVGTLIDRWNGWAVFSCTRQVAEAIVNDHQRQRADDLASREAEGMSPADARREIDDLHADLSFDGDTIVADQRGVCGDPDAIERITPDTDGRYVVMGWNWCWQAVDPYDCDRIVGDLPAPGCEQEFVCLTHTPGMRVPHDGLRLRVVSHWAVRRGLAYVAQLLLDGQSVATVGDDAAGSGPDMVCTHPAAIEALEQFLAGCRYEGQPVGWARLLEALADEVYLAAAVKQTTADGEALVRTVDDTGHTRALRPIHPKPAGWAELTRLGTDLARESTSRWEIWTAGSWQPLPTHAHHIA